MNKRILFFINPVSGTNSKNVLASYIKKECSIREVYFEIIATSREGAYDFLPKKIAVDNISDVVICGGDGSIAPIVAAIDGTMVNVGIIPVGSGNGLARTVGISRSIKKALQNIFQGVVNRVDAYTVNNQMGCHLSGLGFDALVAHEFSKSKKRGGNTYTKKVLQHFLRAKTYTFTLTCEEKQWNEEAFFICIANSNQFGNNFKIAPKAGVNDGLLDVIIVKKTIKPKLLLDMIVHLLSGKLISTPTQSNASSIHYFQTSKITIENVDNAPFHLDGDPFDSQNMYDFEILPNAYCLITPKVLT